MLPPDAQGAVAVPESGWRYLLGSSGAAEGTVKVAKSEFRHLQRTACSLNTSFPASQVSP